MKTPKYELPISEEASDKAFADAVAKDSDENGDVEEALNFDMLAIPDEFKNPGMAQKWIGKDKTGQRYAHKRRLGWKPIEGMPDYHDLQACEMPRERADKIRKHFDKEADAQIASILANPNKKLGPDGTNVIAGKGDYSRMTFPNRRREGRGDAVARIEMDNRRKYFDMGGR